MKMQPIEQLIATFQETGDVLVRNQITERFWPILEKNAAILAARLPESPEWDAVDLAQEGFFGLIDAINRFESSREVLFKTFSQKRINGAMIDAIRRRDWVPRRVRQSEAVPKQMQRIEWNRGNQVEPVDDRRPIDPLQIEGFWRHWLHPLDTRERLLLLLYYREGLTMREVGLHLGMSESRVSQIHSQLLITLQRSGGFRISPEVGS